MLSAWFLSNAFVKFIYSGIPHSRQLCSSTLNTVRWSSHRWLGRNPAWSGGCIRCRPGASRAFCTVANNLYNSGRLRLACSCLHPLCHLFWKWPGFWFSPACWCEVFLLRKFVEDCPKFSFVSSLQFLSCSTRIPLLSFAFPFFSLSMATWISFIVNSFMKLFCSGSFSSSSVFGFMSPPVYSPSPSYKSSKKFAKTLAVPCLVLMVSPSLSLTFPLLHWFDLVLGITN